MMAAWVNRITKAEHNAKIATAYAARVPPPDAYQVRAVIPNGRYEQTVHMTGSEMVNALNAGWRLWDSFAPGWEWVISEHGYLHEVDRKDEALEMYKEETMHG